MLGSLLKGGERGESMHRCTLIFWPSVQNTKYINNNNNNNNDDNDNDNDNDNLFIKIFQAKLIFTS